MTTENRVSGIVRRTLEPLLEERGTVYDELAKLEAEVTEKKLEAKTIDKLLRDGGLLEKPEPKTNGSRPRSSGYPAASAETVERTRDALTNYDGPFTTKDLAETMVAAEATAKKGIEALRESGEVRLVGMRVPEGNAAQIKAAHYESVA